MKPLNDQQRLYLVESDQLYRAWREAQSRSRDYRYGMRWKQVNGTQYLIRLQDAHGNGKSLGRRSTETEDLYARFIHGKQVADQTLAGLSEKLKTQSRLNRALRLGRMPTIVGDILLRLDETRALKELRVVGTHALFAYESMAGAEFKVELLASGDVDLLFDGRKKIALLAKKLEDRGLLELLRKADKTFQASGLDRFRAINKDGFMVDFITQDRGMESTAPEKMAAGDLEAVEVPNLEWLANVPRFEQVVISANGQPVMMPVPDPRAFALHKAWLSAQRDREPVKKQRDLNQAKMLGQCLREYLPNFPLEPDAVGKMRYLPKDMIEKSLALIAGAV
ncbi:MAG: nucleotidyltransferase domain-containing protein [Burkholderiaceae bacterium]|nr:nucleotidyltransferase domain-containing protein [Burkholderiaceae bacterium]